MQLRIYIDQSEQTMPSLARPVRMLAPRAVPAAIVTTLSQATAKAVQQKDVQAKLEGEAAEAVGSTPEQFGDYLRQQVDKYRKLVSAGIRPSAS